MPVQILRLDKRTGQLVPVTDSGAPLNASLAPAKDNPGGLEHDSSGRTKLVVADETPPTFLIAQTFWLPKKGNEDEDYEDAFAFDVATGRVAVADGATESSFAARWAQALVRGFVSQLSSLSPQPVAQFLELLNSLQQGWHKSISWDSLPWFAEEKARAGAFSSIVGLAFVGDFQSRQDGFPPLRWCALAVGDSCLFHMRQDSVLKAFPLEHSEQFGNRPLLLSSNPVNNQQVWSEVCYAEGEAQPGDVFLLVTDALAHWFLTEREKGAQPWKTVTDLKTKEAFASFIDGLRESGSMRNDDTTLLMVRVADAAPNQASEAAFLEGLSKVLPVAPDENLGKLPEQNTAQPNQTAMDDYGLHG